MTWKTYWIFTCIIIGKAFITVHGITSIVDSNSGEICVPIGVVHEWGLSEENNNQEDLIIWERTEPIDEQKEIFFRNMVSLLIDSSVENLFSSQIVNRYLSIRDILQILMIFRSLDNYPVISNGIGKIYITYSIRNIANLLFNLKLIYIEYTPKYLLDKYQIKHQWKISFIFNLFPKEFNQMNILQEIFNSFSFCILVKICKFEFIFNFLIKKFSWTYLSCHLKMINIETSNFYSLSI